MPEDIVPAAAPVVETPATNDVAPDGIQGEAVAAKTFTQAEVDVILAERLTRAKNKAKLDLEKAQADADAKVKAEQGDFKTLWETEKVAREKAEADKRGLELAGFKRDAAAKHNLPAALANRLMGETAEEIEADAKELAGTLPKPGAPNINSNAGGAPRANALDDAERERLASIYGVSKKHFGIQ